MKANTNHPQKCLGGTQRYSFYDAVNKLHLKHSTFGLKRRNYVATQTQKNAFATSKSSYLESNPTPLTKSVSLRYMQQTDTPPKTREQFFLNIFEKGEMQNACNLHQYKES